MRELAVTGSEIILEFNFFVRRPRYLIVGDENWYDLFNELRLLVDQMLQKIIFFPLFSNKHLHFLEVNSPKFVITHYNSNAKSKRNMTEVPRVVSCNLNISNRSVIGN